MPGLNGFVGEFLILLGIYQTSTVFGIIATTGVVLAAVYMLWMFQRVVWGEIKHEANSRLADLSVREWIVLAPLVVLMIWIGVYSQPFMRLTEVSSKHLIHTVQAKQLRANGQAFVTTDLMVPGGQSNVK